MKKGGARVQPRKRKAAEVIAHAATGLGNEATETDKNKVKISRTIANSVGFVRSCRRADGRVGCLGVAVPPKKRRPSTPPPRSPPCLADLMARCGAVLDTVQFGAPYHVLDPCECPNPNCPYGGRTTGTSILEQRFILFRRFVQLDSVVKQSLLLNPNNTRCE